MPFSAFAPFDAAVAAFARPLAAVPALARGAWALTLTGDATVMTVLATLTVLLLLAWGRRREALALAVVMAADPIAADALKSFFARPRPPLAGMLIALPAGASLPSGHAMAAAAFYGCLLVFALRGGAAPRVKALGAGAAALAALAVGMSRVVLGVHWASDVVAGWAAGGVLAAAAWGALTLWERLRGPEALPGRSRALARRMAVLGGVAALVAVAFVVRQAGLDPLL